MNHLTELKEDILRSLLSVPATEKVLFEREFLKNKSKEGLHILIQSLEIQNLIYYSGKTIKVNRQTLKKLKPYIYDEYRK